jgi:hypothetical protein
MHKTTRCQEIDQPAGRCYEKHCAKKFGYRGGKSGIIWNMEGEAEHGYKNLVCPEVCRINHVGITIISYPWKSSLASVGSREMVSLPFGCADGAFRDFTDTEILKVGECLSSASAAHPDFVQGVHQR